MSWSSKTLEPNEVAVSRPVLFHGPVLAQLPLSFILRHGCLLLDYLLFQPAVPTCLAKSIYTSAETQEETYHGHAISKVPVVESLDFNLVFDCFCCIDRRRDHSRFRLNR